MREALPKIASHASKFWQSASGYMGRETLKQKAMLMPVRKLRLGGKVVKPREGEFREHEVVSIYALSAFHTSPEALHEFRKVISIDGKAHFPDATAKEKFRAVLNAKDDWAKRTLAEDYSKEGLPVAATDFGQLILLFTKSNLDKYEFQPKSTSLIGAERAVVIEFRQSAGAESLRISEAGKEVRQPLSGEIWVRESDCQPLRITLTSVRVEDARQIRDEARVDYATLANGTILPSAVTYRRYVGDALYVENISEYSDWQPVNPQ